MRILDVCCGGKMFWFDKNNPFVTFYDIREEEHFLSNGQTIRIKPDEFHDFRNLPDGDNTVDLIIFDPPHLKNSAGRTGWMVKKYGRLEKDWESQITESFEELFRVLKWNGTLIFKWNEVNIKVSEILKCSEFKPMIGHKSGKQSKTHWILFIKHWGMKK